MPMKNLIRNCFNFNINKITSTTTTTTVTTLKIIKNLHTNPKLATKLEFNTSKIIIRNRKSLSSAWLNNKSNKNVFDEQIRSMTTSTSSQSRASTSTSTKTSTASINDNVITINKAKRLMRLIYARVHPDLYTNHLHAQVSFFERLFYGDYFFFYLQTCVYVLKKQNENSLKILRNLIDSYLKSDSSSSNYNIMRASSSSLNSTQSDKNNLIFYVREIIGNKKNFFY